MRRESNQGPHPLTKQSALPFLTARSTLRLPSSFNIYEGRQWHKLTLFLTPLHVQCSEALCRGGGKVWRRIGLEGLAFKPWNPRLLSSALLLPGPGKYLSPSLKQTCFFRRSTCWHFYLIGAPGLSKQGWVGGRKEMFPVLLSCHWAIHAVFC